MELAYQLKIDKQKREEQIVELDNVVKNLDKKVKELEENKVGRYTIIIASYT